MTAPRTYGTTVTVRNDDGAEAAWGQASAVPQGTSISRYDVVIGRTRLGGENAPSEYAGLHVGVVRKNEVRGFWQYVPADGGTTWDTHTWPSLAKCVDEVLFVFLSGLVESRRQPYPCWACGAPVTAEEDQAGTHEHVLPARLAQPPKPAHDAVMRPSEFVAWVTAVATREAVLTVRDAPGPNVTFGHYLEDLRSRLGRTAAEAPRPPRCTSRGGAQDGWQCTRPVGHDGRHSHEGDRVTWDRQADEVGS